MKNERHSFEEALCNFQNALIANYGTEGGLVKIEITRELFNHIMNDVLIKQRYPNFRPSDIGNTQILGIRITPVCKGEFK